MGASGQQPVHLLQKHLRSSNQGSRHSILQASRHASSGVLVTSCCGRGRGARSSATAAAACCTGSRRGTSSRRRRRRVATAGAVAGGLVISVEDKLLHLHGVFDQVQAVNLGVVSAVAVHVASVAVRDNLVGKVGAGTDAIADKELRQQLAGAQFLA